MQDVEADLSRLLVGMFRDFAGNSAATPQASACTCAGAQDLQGMLSLPRAQGPEPEAWRLASHVDCPFRAQAPSPTGEGGGTPTTALDLSRLRASSDSRAAAVVVQTVCERALLRRDAAAADELVAAGHVLYLAGS